MSSTLSQVDSAASPAFSSLRSKFEQISSESDSSLPPPAPTLAAKWPTTHASLSPDPTTIRPRAISGSGSYPDARDSDQHSLRQASSSSDLKSGTKRPPPPPPTRKQPSPANGSPLSRPVPLPTTNSAPPNPSLSRPVPPPNITPPSLQLETESSSSMPPMGGVASIRNRLLASTSSPITSIPSTSQLPPLIPPRISKHSNTSAPSLVASPDTFAPRIHSPFSDGDDPSEPVPPPLPKRTRPNGTHHTQTPSNDTTSSGSSRKSSESDTSFTNRPYSPTPKRIPPRPPPRNSGLSSSSTESSLNYSDSTSVPPPLPLRRNVPPPGDDQPSPPKLPLRPAAMQSDQSLPASTERKILGSHKLPPPPTRTIAIGDKLPPVRRPTTPSSEDESGEDDDSKTYVMDLLPDSSHSSRRPPTVTCHTYSDSRIHVAPYSGHVAVSGYDVLVGSGHHIRCYNLQESDSPVWDFETKTLGLKDVKISALEIKAGGDGCFLWAGTKEGHLFEMDIRTGRVLGMKPIVHAHTVTHILKQGPSMITLDDTGKVLIWSPEADGEEVWLGKSPNRVLRIAEKQDFAKMMGGWLWTSARSEHSATNGKGPIVRVFNVFVQGSCGRSLLPTEHLGTVTSGAVLPSHSGHVYLGHEAGFISIWELESEDGFPRCVEVMKVSASDVLTLDGVHDRLWAGGRKGMISAYDVTSRPWVVTNSWMAHGDLPVLKVGVDPYSVERCGQLCVFSVGRDERIRFWDGLLGANWIDQELLKREKSFSRYRELSVLLVSWNLDSARPDSLNGDLNNQRFFEDVLKSVDRPDIISFGFQEVIDLESRRMTAKTLVLGKKKGEEGKLLENVTGAYKRWHDYLVQAVQMHMPSDVRYSVVHVEALVGLFTCIFVKESERATLKDPALATIKRGMGGMYGNKGGIVTRFVIDDTSICLINCHLAAGQRHVRQRNADVAAMLEDKAVFPAAGVFEEPVAYVGGGDGSMVLDHEIVFVSGDMNYRIDQRRDHIVAAVHAGDVTTLYAHDQLLKEMKFNRGFRFRSFVEGPITFAPTYKYERGSDEYDLSEKQRIPAWCDRVLWKARDGSRVRQMSYRRWEVDVSDHRPVSAGFRIMVKSVRSGVRKKVRGEVEGMWKVQEKKALVAVREFFVEEGMIG